MLGVIFLFSTLRAILLRATKNRLSEFSFMARRKIENSLFVFRLRELMNNKSLTQKALAIRANVAQGAISDYLRATRIPGAAELFRLSQALGVTMDYLWGATEESLRQDQVMASSQELRGALQFAVGTLEGALGTLKKYLPENSVASNREINVAKD